MAEINIEIKRSHTLGAYGAQLGFDWESPEQVLAKINEEVKEIQEALVEGSREDVIEEVGDLFFSFLNLCRHLGIEEGRALQLSNDKFERRLNTMLQMLEEDGTSVKALSFEELDTYWEKAKSACSKRE